MILGLAPLSEERAGALSAGLAYVIWGVMPLYWRLLSDVPSFEVTVHRVIWCAVTVALVTAAMGHLRRVMAAVRDPKLVAILALTSLLISSNWAIYIYCVETEQLVEASLGYYMTPLISFALGFIFFRERMSRLRMLCLGLATVALAAQVAALGHVPWIAPVMAISFGLYGYFRKRAPVAALDGLLIETLVLLPIGLGFVIFWSLRGTSAFPSENLVTTLLLIGSGPATAIPLALFAAGARRVTMTTLGFLQYLAPSITLLMAVMSFHEAFSQVDLISFGCVWTALVLVALEGRFNRDAKPKPSTT